jgi:hypothetical protein
MANEGDAAEQVIRIALTGGDIALRLTGSLIKNVAAFLLAMRQNNKAVYGRKSVKKLLQNTRDLRVFPMTPEQFRMFQRRADRQKILYAGVGDRLRRPTTVDLLLPITEIERANVIFESIGFKQDKSAEAPEYAQDNDKKKGSPLRSNSKNSRDKSTTQSKNSSRTNEKPSVTAKLEVFDATLKQQAAKSKARPKARPFGKGR